MDRQGTGRMRIEQEKAPAFVSERRQMSESFQVGIFLALGGGFQDAYTYIMRGQVFANAQTGNIVLMSVNFLAGNGREGMAYLFPVLSFAFGVFAAECIREKFKYASFLHWRQGILLLEMAVMAVTGFLPASLSMPANMLVSFSCAMQVQSFRKVGGNAYASTMCIGNLRSGMSALSLFLNTKEKREGQKAACYFGIIGFFAVGAGLGGNLSFYFGLRTIWICIAFLFTAFCLMAKRH